MTSRWRRFRFQISLRTIFFGVAAISMLLAYWVHVVAPQIARKRALARMRELGAEVFSVMDVPWVGIDQGVAGDRKAAEVVALLAYFPKVRLNLGFDARITDEAITGLAGSANVETLIIGAPRITNAGVKSVAQMRGVQHVSLTSAGVDCASIGALAEIEGLQSLYVDGVQFDWCACGEVAKLADIEELQLRHMQIAEGNITRLATMQKLTSLRLSSLRMPSESFREITACKGLKHLYVSGISLPEPTPGGALLAHNARIVDPCAL